MIKAPDNIGSTNNSIVAVINIERGYRGKEDIVREYERRFRIVIKKFIDVSADESPDISRAVIKIETLEGDRDIKEVLKGGYNVQPVPPPNSVIIDKIRHRYENTRRIKEKLFILGKAISGDP